jgi:hypothetical protein
LTSRNWFWLLCACIPCFESLHACTWIQTQVFHPISRILYRSCDYINLFVIILYLMILLQYDFLSSPRAW